MRESHAQCVRVERSAVMYHLVISVKGNLVFCHHFLSLSEVHWYMVEHKTSGIANDVLLKLKENIIKHK